MALRERHTERKIIGHALKRYGLRSPRCVVGPLDTMALVPTEPERLLWIAAGYSKTHKPTIRELIREYKCDHASLMTVMSQVRCRTPGGSHMAYEDGRTILRAVRDYFTEVIHTEDKRVSRRFNISKHKDCEVTLRDPTPPPTREMREAWDKETRFLTRGYRGNQGRELIIPIESLRHEWEPRLWKTKRQARCYRCRKVGLCSRHYTTEHFTPNPGGVTDLDGF